MGVRIETAEVLALARRIDDFDYYRLLRLERGARATEIRAAYHEMRRAFHPDAFVSASRDLRDAVDRIARRVSEAYLVLRNPARREAYDRGLDRGTVRYSREEEKDARKETGTQLGSTAQGRKLYAQSEAAARRGDLKAAASSLKLALGFEPGNKRFKARLEELEKAIKAARRAAR